MKQALALLFILLAVGCVSNRQACEAQYNKPADIETCIAIRDQADREAWRRMNERHMQHGAGGCTPNHSTGGCLD